MPAHKYDTQNSQPLRWMLSYLGIGRNKSSRDSLSQLERLYVACSSEYELQAAYRNLEAIMLPKARELVEKNIPNGHKDDIKFLQLAKKYKFHRVVRLINRVESSIVNPAFFYQNLPKREGQKDGLGKTECQFFDANNEEKPLDLSLKSRNRK